MVCFHSKTAVVLALLVFSCAGAVSARAAASFRARQLSAPRVKAARQQIGEQVRQLFEGKGVAYPARVLFVRSLKREQRLELWAGNDPSDALILVDTFDICANSGTLGPKRQEGDLQVPEGFYVVDRYNAWSSFHLSLGINYPNRADRRRHRDTPAFSLGGNIFIHGDCVSIGCVPIENGPMQVLYLAALDTRLAYGARAGALEVHMFPGRMDTKSFAELVTSAEPDEELNALWNNLKEGWDAFESTHKKPLISVDAEGRYVVEPRR